MEPSRIHAVNHVELEAPYGADDSIRWFYAEVAGLDEMPADGDAPARIRFKSERIELRLKLVDRPVVEQVAVRVTIGVRSLAETEALLEERKVPYECVSGISFTDRVVLAKDPAGHLVAFRRVWDIGVL